MSTRFRLRMRSKAPGRRSVEALAVALLAPCTVFVGAGPALAGSPATLAISTQTTLVQPAGGAGYKFFDTATLSGAPSDTLVPTGTVTFNVYGPITYPFVDGPGSCAGAPQYTSTNPVNAAGTGATSNTFVPPDGEEKIYLFTASYSGDAVYAPVTSECDAPGESVRVPFVAFAMPEPIVVPPTTPPSASPPISVSELTFSPAAFAVGNNDGSARKTAQTKKLARRSPQGTTISYVLSGAGTVTIRISKVVTGLRVAGRGCVPATAAARKALLAGARGARWSALLRHARCKASRTVGVLVRASKAGSNSFPFTGRMGSRVLTAGSYKADASLSPAATSPSTASAAFQIVPAAR
jgi:hypothetical protein